MEYKRARRSREREIEQRSRVTKVRCLITRREMPSLLFATRALDSYVSLFSGYQNARFANLTLSGASNEIVSFLVIPGLRRLEVSTLVFVLWTKFCLRERARPAEHREYHLQAKLSVKT